MNIFEASTFKKNSLADFGETQDGFTWYLIPKIKMDWDFEKLGNDIAEIFLKYYNFPPPKSFKNYHYTDWDFALENGFPVCILKNYMVCTYLIRTSDMIICNFLDAEGDCKLIARELSKKYSYLTENINQMELTI